MYEVHFYRNTNGTWDSGRGAICKAFGWGDMGTAPVKRQDFVFCVGRKFIYFVKSFYEKHTKDAQKRD